MGMAQAGPTTNNQQTAGIKTINFRSFFVVVCRFLGAVLRLSFQCCGGSVFALDVVVGNIERWFFFRLQQFMIQIGILWVFFIGDWAHSLKCHFEKVAADRLPRQVLRHFRRKKWTDGENQRVLEPVIFIHKHVSPF